MISITLINYSIFCREYQMTEFYNAINYTYEILMDDNFGMRSVSYYSLTALIHI